MRDLYFIAIIPPFSLAQELDELRHQIWRHFGARHTLNSPPHVTLVSPFECFDYAALKEGLIDFCANEEPIDISLSGFGHFGHRVLYVSVRENPPLDALQQRLDAYCREIMKLPLSTPPSFHPHLTLATRDLKKEMFSEAWDWLQGQSVEAGFRAGEIFLLRHSGKRWLIDRKLPLRED